MQRQAATRASGAHGPWRHDRETKRVLTMAQSQPLGSLSCFETDFEAPLPRCHGAKVARDAADARRRRVGHGGDGVSNDTSEFTKLVWSLSRKKTGVGERTANPYTPTRCPTPPRPLPTHTSLKTLRVQQAARAWQRPVSSTPPEAERRGLYARAPRRVRGLRFAQK